MAQKHHQIKNIYDTDWKIALDNTNKRMDPDLASWMTKMKYKYIK